MDNDNIFEQVEAERDFWKNLCVNLVLDRNIQALQKEQASSPLLPFLLGVKAGLSGEFHVLEAPARAVRPQAPAEKHTPRKYTRRNGNGTDPEPEANLLARPHPTVTLEDNGMLTRSLVGGEE